MGNIKKIHQKKQPVQYDFQAIHLELIVKKLDIYYLRF